MSNDPIRVDNGVTVELTRRTAELEKRVRDLEYALLSMAGSHLVGASLCDATSIDSGSPGAAPSAPTIAAASQGAVNQSQESPLFRLGDRVCVYTGGDPCVKPGTVEQFLHDGRWLIQLDKAGRIKASVAEMVLIPGAWT